MSTSIRDESAAVSIDQASNDDLVSAAHVYQSAAEDLSDRLRARNPWTDSAARAEDLKQAIRSLSILRGSDARSVIVARVAGEVVGMAAVQIQPPHAHIAFFFVHPEVQNKGVGRQLLDHLRGHIDRSGATVTTLASSRDPKAWQRYMRLGLHPGPPLLPFRATHPVFPLHPPVDVHLTRRPATSADLDAMAELDRMVRGAERRARLAEWLGDGNSGILVIDRETQRPVGYAFVSLQDKHGQIGPVVATSGAHFPFTLNTALHAAGQISEWASRPWRIDFSARNSIAIRPLLDAGFSAENLVNWFESEPVGCWDRYIFRDEDEL